MNRSCGQEEYQVHLQALRAQLLHLNPSHWGGRSVSESCRLRQSCSWALSASRHCLPLPALPASGKYLPFLLKFTFSFKTTLSWILNYLAQATPGLPCCSPRITQDPAGASLRADHDYKTFNKVTLYSQPVNKLT